MSNKATQFKKGQIANPQGRPKREWTMSSIIEQSLEEVDPTTGKTYKHIIAEKLRAIAARGDMQAIKEITNRMDGMPKQAIEHEGDLSFNITLSRENKDEK